jgi:rhodanese-related sulfurtransferase
MTSTHVITVGSLDQAFKLSDSEFKAKYSFPKPLLSEENVIVYCKRGVRAETARQILTSHGYGQTKNYLGSWSEWCQKYVPF